MLGHMQKPTSFECKWKNTQNVSYSFLLKPFITIFVSMVLQQSRAYVPKRALFTSQSLLLSIKRYDLPSHGSQIFLSLLLERCIPISPSQEWDPGKFSWVKSGHVLCSTYSLTSRTRKLNIYRQVQISLHWETSQSTSQYIKKVKKVQTPFLPSLRLHVGWSKPQKEWTLVVLKGTQTLLWTPKDHRLA